VKKWKLQERTISSEKPIRVNVLSCSCLVDEGGSRNNGGGGDDKKDDDFDNYG
jgi:hypothetical protein